MRRKLWIALTLALLLCLCAAGALAADTFRFETKTLTMNEGETAQPVLIRDGTPAEDGTMTYTVSNKKVLSVTPDGQITALGKGQANVKATLKIGKRSFSASLSVTVVRAVRAVTLNTTQLQVFRPTDEAVSGLLRMDTANDVIVIPAGKSVELRTTCTPSDATSKKIIYTSSDEGILKTGEKSARALQAGECELTIASAQNPEVTETYHVLVIQPVTKITISAPEGKTVGVGGTISLQAEVSPANASIRGVSWRSKNEAILRVDADGNVTGVKRGMAAVEAKALDGSGRTESITLTVTQPVTAVSIREQEVILATRQNTYVHASVLPENASERGVVWSSSDESIARVNASGQVQGVSRGECTLIAASKSNPEVTAEIPVRVVQKVTSVTFPDGPVSLPKQTTEQLRWQVLPADASIQDVTFTSSNRKVATVDESGVVTGLTRGSAVITATATDGSGKRGQVRVTVTQPVEGVSIQYGVYHVQLERSLNIKALIQPSNANNQNVHFTMGDDYIATVSDQKNIGRVKGWHTGTTTITGTTEDGGYTASAEVRVADFNRAVVIDDLYLEGENIRLVLRNRGNFTVDRVYFTVETYDGSDQPLVCNLDGVSNSFQGVYRLEIGPDETSDHYEFDFGDYVQPLSSIGTVVVKVTGWRDTEGYTRNIPEEEYPSQSFRRFVPKMVLPSADGDGEG